MSTDPTHIQKKILNLPPDEQKEVIDFIEFLEQKNNKEKREKTSMTFEWEGGLKDLKEKYTSVELQHKINEWRIEDAFD
ncbi:MAG: hypothetical protein A3I68_08390 [Candidatus Melainabacteria bacterium RIFCSPLOWO2_02_FULL_35_15]|nr:MAG: hypothetical protein A3F80_08615 [Candidatus Melainabacteria bacterium RIFCSPLOWO2_12_FULL_35_11]OGI13989.1 MAG: hypothetical protein A3I68_08390 [Candidatus Melainabacteria bacterium RIFCSPLOWO2_02_FULL_35_15]